MCISEEEETERRRDTTIDEPASMTVLHPLSPDRVDIRIVEMTPRALKLLVPQFLQIGSIVQVRVKGVIALGEVRSCQPASGGFHLALRLQDVVPSADALRDALIK